MVGLTLSSISSAVVFAGSAPAVASAATPTLARTGALLQAADANALDLIATNFSTRISLPFVLNQAVELERAEPFSVSIGFDSRLFQSGEIAVVSCAGRFAAATTTVADNGDAAASTVTFDFPDIFEDGSDTDVTVPLPLTVRDRYPDEAIDDPFPLSLTLTNGAGEIIASAAWAPAVLDGEVTSWGAELSAGWVSATVVDGAKTKADKYRYPSTLTCVSVGPGEVPAGSQLTIEMDARVIASCVVAEGSAASWTDGAYTVESHIDVDVLRTIVTLNQSLVSGDTAHFSLTCVEQATDPTIEGYVQAMAMLAGPTSEGLWQRPTNKYQSIDVTPSGSPQVPGVAEGTI